MKGLAVGNKVVSLTYNQPLYLCINSSLKK